MINDVLSGIFSISLDFKNRNNVSECKPEELMVKHLFPVIILAAEANPPPNEKKKKMNAQQY